MTRTHRHFGMVAVAVGLSAAALGHAPAQPPGKVPGKTREPQKPYEGVSLPIDREAKRLVQAAQDYIKKKEWRVAAECLQSLLDAREDTFFEADGDSPQAAKQLVSVRKEANRLVGELPPEGLEFYQVQYGQAAEAKLNEALDKHDTEALADVSMRYLHTKAGAEATALLASYHLDQGNYLMAALGFERLLGRADADKLSARTLFKAVLAYRRAGDVGTAEKVWKRLADKAGSAPLVFGTKKYTLDQLRREAERPAQLVALAMFTDWPVFRGGPARNAQGVGGTAFLEPRWQAPMRIDEATPDIPKEDSEATIWVESKLKAALDGLKDKAKLPAFFPVAANGKLIYRTYDGVYAAQLKDVDAGGTRLRAGELVWRSGTAAGLHGVARVPGRRSELERWLSAYNNASGVVFENSLVGTLSHDNHRVYFVDDVAVPPYPQVQVNGFIGGATPQNFGELDAAVKGNRLVAVELESGKSVWNLGEPEPAGPGAAAANRDAKDGVESAAHLGNTHFLGPPLPLGGKLYLPIERNGEFRLLCLDPSKPDAKGYPELVWQQGLGTPNKRLIQDPYRRMQAVHLAYADGVLVVPTHSGVVLGVDLLAHGLVWRYFYIETPPPEDIPNVRFGRGRITHIAPPQLRSDRWRTSAPAIVDGKVVFTAHDAEHLHCINLRDGEPLWKVKREDDDLYFAGVFGGKALVVGKRQVKAYDVERLARTPGASDRAWTLETGGLPSGQGVASDDVYYLPLASTGDANQPGPGILAINVQTGKPVSVPARRKQELPGNLVFVEGDIVSQTPTAVAAYPQEALKRAEITRRLKDNPRDPVGLAERGELLLYAGKMSEAIDDLRAALALNPPADARAKARGKLYEALAELFQTDFPAAEKFVDEFQSLTKLDVPADADALTKAKLSEESTRRADNFLSLVGRGREKQGRVLDALAAYEELGSREDPSRHVTVVDEPNASARRDVLARGRIKSLYDRATPEQRKQLEDRLSERFRAVAGGSVANVKKFLDVVGTFSRAGREAQLHLAERYLAGGSSDELAEAEKHLLGLCTATEVRRNEPAVAARALDAMARVYVKRELFEDAVGLIKQLGTEFGSVPLRDGRTGADLLAELYTDKRFLPYLEQAGLNWRGVFRASEAPGAIAPRESSLTLEPEGATLPFYQRHRLVLDTSGNGPWKLVLRDRVNGDEKCSWGNLTPAKYFQNFPGQGRNPGQLRFAFARGHILILHLANMVHAIDLAEGGGRELWKYNLLASRAHDANTLSHMQPDEEGRLWLTQNTNVKERVGQVAVFEPGLVCLQTDRGLIAVDPRKADPRGDGPVELWRRSDVSTRAHAFGDGEYVFAVETPEGGGATTVRAFSAADGSPVAVPDFGGLFAPAKRLRVAGRHLLLQELDKHGFKVLRLYDIPTGRDVWRQQFHTAAIVAKSEDPALAAVYEPDRTVTVLDLRDGEVQFKSHLEEDHADRLRELTLLADRERVYLALSRTPDPGLNWSPLVSPGIRTVKTNGALYALSRATGKIEWVCPELNHQVLILEQLQDLPLLLLASTYQRAFDNGSMQRDQARVTAVDKRTGKLVFDSPLVQTMAFHSLKAEPAKGLIELVRPDLRISFRAEPPAATP